MKNRVGSRLGRARGPCPVRMLKLGKHRGHSFADVASRDRSYCAWILREKDLPQGFKKFRAHLIDTHGGVVPVGKYRGQFFDFVRASDPDFCAWVVSLKADPSAFEPNIQYLFRAGLLDEESPAKKPRADKDDLCKICFVQEIRTCQVPCGHLVACMMCAERLGEDPCPICKQPVAFVQKTYRA